MIGDNTADENGHGTRMAQLVAEQNPDVSILSIKALGADGTGDISAVYAAIRYAIDKRHLSLTFPCRQSQQQRMQH